jgi:hypothetical protein
VVHHAMGNFHRRIKRLSSLSRITPFRHEIFWTHWNLSALRLFYGLAASDSETEFRRAYKVRRIYDRFLTDVQF